MVESDDKKAKTDDLGRKVWDRSQYVNKTSTGNDVEDTISTILPHPNRRPVIAVPEVRENLKRRTDAIDLTKDIGKSQVINALAPKSQQGGFYCKVCDCLLKDSQSYLDHINGRKHNRMLGMTMRVEKVDVRTVANKLRKLAAQDSSQKVTREQLEQEAQERIKELEMSERDHKERKKLLKKRKKIEEVEVKLEDDVYNELELMKASGLPVNFN